MFLVVADMVLKPSYTDFPVLAAMVLILIGGAVVFLAPVLRSEAGTA